MLLFSSTNRDEAHRTLEQILAEGQHPRAECREDPNVDKPYQVWSGPAERVATAPVAPDLNLTPEMLAKLKELLK